MKKLILSMLLIVLSFNLLLADVPKTISYQGILTDSNGNPVADGNYELRFELTTGSGDVLWIETHESVPVTNGLFNVILGSVNGGFKLPFNETYFLGISINGGGTLQPFTELSSVPYSLNVSDDAAVKSLNGHTGNLIVKAGNNVSVATNNDTITISTSGDGNGGITLPFEGIVADDLAAFKINNSGNGIGVLAQASGPNASVAAVNSGDGPAGFFQVANSQSGSSAVSVVSEGTGNAITSTNTGTNGHAGFFRNTNPDNNSPSLFVDTDGGVAGIEATNSSGVGYAGIFMIDDPDFIGAALYAQSPSGAAIHAVSYDSAVTLEISSHGSAPGISATKRSETGKVASFNDLVTSNSESAVYITAKTDVLGIPALEVEHTGRGTAGEFKVTDENGPAPALVGKNEGTGVAVQGETTGSGFNSFGVWALASTGTGVPLKVTQNGTGINLALFQFSNTNVARIDNTGKAFFNGGTQTGGADIAEAFNVVGSVMSYQPGDVLSISPENDRTVELSQSPYSTLVAGVYATKPGVLLSEKNIDADLSDQVPMGVVGVLPTKVCTENGPVKRGDLLVTSSIPGYAMKGTDRSMMLGAVIGKALEDFEGDKGIISVLVNVK